MTNLTPNIIYVYAVDTVKTVEDHVSDQGFGHSIPLATPVCSTFYRWEGKLHGSRPNVVRSSWRSDDLDALARNLAEAVKAHPSLAHNNVKTNAYQLSYGSTSPGFAGNPEDTPRPLKPEEHNFFDEAFKRHILWGI